LQFCTSFWNFGFQACLCCREYLDIIAYDLVVLRYMQTITLTLQLCYYHQEITCITSWSSTSSHNAY